MAEEEKSDAEAEKVTARSVVHTILSSEESLEMKEARLVALVDLLTSRVSALESEVSESKDLMIRQTTLYKNSIAKLEAEFAKQISELQSRHAEQLTHVQDQYTTIISEMHALQVSQLEQAAVVKAASRVRRPSQLANDTAAKSMNLPVISEMSASFDDESVVLTDSSMVAGDPSSSVSAKGASEKAEVIIDKSDRAHSRKSGGVKPLTLESTGSDHSSSIDSSQILVTDDSACAISESEAKKDEKQSLIGAPTESDVKSEDTSFMDTASSVITALFQG